MFKNSALALTIGVFELTAQSRQIESFTFQGFEAFTAATVVYLRDRADRDRAACAGWSAGRALPDMRSG